MPATGRGRRRTAQTEPATPSPKRQCRPARFQEIFDAMRTYKDDSGEFHFRWLEYSIIKIGNQHKFH